MSQEKTLVQAVQWVPGKKVEGVRIIGEKAFLDRLEGDLEILPGDWVVQGLYGPFRMDDATFHQFYRVA